MNSPDMAQQHRPQDRETMRAAVIELRQRLALTPRDIAAALQLSEAVVRQFLPDEADR